MEMEQNAKRERKETGFERQWTSAMYVSFFTHRFQVDVCIEVADSLIL